MKKYIWEVGMDIQTIYFHPEADTAEEAEKDAYDKMKWLVNSWKGFDYDYYSSSAEIEGVTQEYARFLTKDTLETKKKSKGWQMSGHSDDDVDPNEGNTDREILDYLMDLAEVDTLEALEDILQHWHNGE